MKKLTLLIDTVTILSPGMLRLQGELTLSALRQLPEGCKIILLQNSAVHCVEPRENLLVINIPPIKLGFLGRWLWYNHTLPGKIKKYKADVFYSLSGILSKQICKSCATISTVNNMVPFDREQVSHFPLFSKDRLRLILLRRLYLKSVKMTSVLLLHSHHALTQIKNYVSDVSGLEEKTTVVLTGISDDLKLDDASIPAHPNKDVPFFFYFSAIYWYKNHINLIEGYRRALEIESDLPVLFLAGYPVDKKYFAEMKQKIVDDDLSEKVKYIGVLPSELVPGYLHHATINIFPSTCETNSVVQSEILGMHGVMACSDVPPMPEIGGRAAVLFDPYNPDSIAECIIKVYKDKALQKSLREKAAERSEELSWDSCGKAIWDCAYKALNNLTIN